VPRARIALFGATGYAGMELTALLASHPQAEVTVATAEHLSGEAVLDRVAGCAIALLAVPPEAARDLVAALHATDVRIVDLSSAYRFDADAVYGMPELSRAGIETATLVANPGCYVTAATLALAPLFAAGLVSRDHVVVDAMSGVTGAGRRVDEHYSFVELHANARSYRVLQHAHEAEIARNLRHACTTAGGVDVTFTPHLVPLARGILATCYLRALAPATAVEYAGLLRDRYRDEPFVRIRDSADDVAVASVVGTNVCEIGVTTQGRRVVVCAAIDNLLKGAAGQALQNMNLMLGCDETAGLTALRRWYP
jgi:N-acetyl-gamma-glutamyl-phosphate reductase